MLLKVAFLDIKEQGDCSVVTFDENNRKACIVIDGGNGNKGKKALIDYLKKESIETIDLMVGTHLDSDHINGLKEFVVDLANQNKKQFTIKNYWGPMPMTDDAHISIKALSLSNNSPESLRMVISSISQNEDLLNNLKELSPRVNVFHPSIELKPPDLFSNLKIDVLWPTEQLPSSEFASSAIKTSGSIMNRVKIIPGEPISDLTNSLNKNFEILAERAKKSINNSSIVLMFTPIVNGILANNFRILFPGDIEREVWDQFKDDHTDLKALILKIPHHGSINGITKDAVGVVNPRFAINMTGQTHGIPDKEPLQYLQQKSVEIYCTQRNNTIDKNKKSACYNLTDCVLGNAKNTSNHVVIELDFLKSNEKIINLVSGKSCKHQF